MPKNEIEGYKCFYEGLETKPGIKMEIGKKYNTKEPPKFHSSGFHMCERMEDTLRFFDSFENKIEICKAIGYPEYKKEDDDYYGYYDMYSCQGILLIKKLTRQEIIEMARNMDETRIQRFLQLYNLNPSELEEFIKKYSDGYHDYILSIIERNQTVPKELSNQLSKRLRRYGNY